MPQQCQFLYSCRDVCVCVKRGVCQSVCVCMSARARVEVCVFACPLPYVSMHPRPGPAPKLLTCGALR